MNRMRTNVIGALAAAMVLAACSSNTPASSVGGGVQSIAPGGAPGAGTPSGYLPAVGSGSIDVCGLIAGNPTLSTGITQVLGAKGAATPVNLGGMSGCAVGTTGSNQVSLSVDSRAEAKTLFQGLVVAPGATSIPGLGDQAYTTTSDNGTVHVGVEKGRFVVYVSVTKKVAGGFASPLDAAKGFANALLTSLGA